MKPERIEELRAFVAKWRSLHPLSPVPIDDAELLYLLRCARAWAELEAWLHENRGCRALTCALTRSDELSFRLDVVAQRAHRGPDLLTATEAALAKAKDGGA